jgi:hypothetical protein
MSLPEIGYRCKEELRKRNKGDCNVNFSQPLLTGSVKWFTDLSVGEKNEEFVREKYGFLSETSENLIAHRFSFFNFDNEHFGSEIDWHRDYKSGKTAPLIHSKTIDYRDYKKVGDIKYIRMKQGRVIVWRQT